jgi:DNA-binding response OmpR family regulator
VIGEYPPKEGWIRTVEAEADVYLEEPISFPEMVARAKAMVHRKENSNGYVKAKVR